MLHQLQRYIREHDLIRPGERVAAAVSGGADSVALLRLLLELRQTLGIVVSVAHLNHQLRGADAGRDADFVAELAERHGLEFHLAERDVRAYAAEHKLSLEAAGRRLRYAFFSGLVAEHKADKVATAHTLDDQAETVLLKLLRGSWLRGLAGIHPSLRAEDGRIWVVRPLLAPAGARSRLICERLRSHGVRTSRTRIVASGETVCGSCCRCLRPNTIRGFAPRWRKLPSWRGPRKATGRRRLPELRQGLISHSAPTRATAAGAEDPDAESVTVDSELLAAQPLALQRRLLRFAGEQVQLKLGFEEVERLRLLLAAHSGIRCELPAGWEATKRAKPD